MEITAAEKVKESVSADKQIKTEVSLPAVVVKAPSIDVGSVVRPTVNAKINKIRAAGTSRPGAKNTNNEFQVIFQNILRRKMKQSWLNTTYQRAIWNARRRLIRGELIDELPEQEKHIATSFLSPRMKPDYSKWQYPKKRLPHGAILPHLQEDVTISNDPAKKPRKDLTKGFLPEHFVHSFRGDSDKSSIGHGGLQVYPIEFLSLSDRLTLHEPPWLTTLRRGAEAHKFDQFGLCYGCFHKKEPHFHYLAPIRTGGGFTIYRRHPFMSNENVPNFVKMDMIRWIAHGEDQNDRITFDQDLGEAALADDFTTGLFYAFLDNGGDPNALKEYLESNFDPGVLKDLETLGTNVQLIKEYADILRRHIREKLALTLEKQEGIVKSS